MRDHADEKHRIKPREWTSKSSHRAPSKRKVCVAGIMQFSRISIPTFYQQTIPRCRLDDSGVSQCTPRKLWEGFSSDESTTFLCSETILLAIHGVPDPIHEDVRRKQENEAWCTKWWDGPGCYDVKMVCDVDSGVAVAKWNAC